MVPHDFSSCTAENSWLLSRQTDTKLFKMITEMAWLEVQKCTNFMIFVNENDLKYRELAQGMPSTTLLKTNWHRCRNEKKGGGGAKAPTKF